MILNSTVLNGLYRGYNGVVAAGVFYQYCSNPQATAAEFLPDVAIHAFEAVMPYKYAPLAIMANFYRGGVAAQAFFTGVTAIPHIANGIDVGNHLGNIAYRLRKMLSQKPEEESLDEFVLLGEIDDDTMPRPLTFSNGAQLAQQEELLGADVDVVDAQEQKASRNKKND